MHKLAEILGKEDAAIVVLLSPQSLAAMSLQLGLPPRGMCRRLSEGLARLSPQSRVWLLDLSFFIDVHQWIHYMEISANKSGQTLITSECPGWICYLEKVVKSPVLSLSSRVKTPQMLAGQILKRFLMESGYTSEKIFVTSVCPCHDKKLETFRPESSLLPNVKEIDLVISTTEMLEFMKGQAKVFEETMAGDGGRGCWQFENMLEARISKGSALTRTELSSLLPYTWQSFPLHSHSDVNSTSNNYLSQLFLKAVFDKTNKLPAESQLVESLRRGKKGYVEVVYRDEGTGTETKGARVYGFKNIQNMIRSLKSQGAESPQYAYIEVMACPGGCYAGGGQVPPKTANADSLATECEQTVQANSQRRYFFQNVLAEKMARETVQGNNHLLPKESIEYNIRPLVTEESTAVHFKW